MNRFHKLGADLLGTLPPETAHTQTIRLLKAGLGPTAKTADEPALAIEVGGLRLPNPVGLAAGFDKNAEVADAMLAVGFGFVECGTVTPRPQAGNPKPRLFRLAEDRAVINRMGFNNTGLERFATRLSRRNHLGPKKRGVVGANLGANKDSTDMIADYVIGLERLWGQCDYFTINISSPNTPGLRDLQSANALEDLLARICDTRQSLTQDKPSPPIFLKVAPDLEMSQVGRVTEQARTYGMNAIIVSNTTLDRPKHLQSRFKGETGGLSGAPLYGKSTEMLREFSAASAGRIDLIGVGGIASGIEAYAKIRAGAKAVQLYSALVFTGPSLVVDIRRDLMARLAADGFKSIAEAVGKS